MTALPEVFRQTMEPLREGLMLDVAAGAGGSAEWLRELLPDGGPIIAVEIDAGILVTGNGRMASLDDVVPVCMDSSRLGFAAGTFSLVSISNSLHHLADLERSLAEMKRVLREGGMLLVREMVRDGQTPAQMTHVLMHDWWADIDTASGKPHFPTLRRPELEKYVERTGLETVAVHAGPPPETDPLDPEALQSIERAVQTYLAKAESLQQVSVFQDRGAELRERLQKIGFHPATSVCILLREPAC